MLWIIGPVFTDFHDYLVSQGIPYGVFHMAEKPPRQPAQRSIPLSMSSMEQLETELAALPADLAVSAILVAGYEQYVVPAAVIAEHFGVPGPSITSARAATDKLLMREAFQAASPSITPPFKRVENWEDVESFVKHHGLPVVLKPANLMKSLFVTKNFSIEELETNYREIVSALPAHYAALPGSLQPEIIIESFLEGSMHTVAGCVEADGSIQLVPHIVDCLPAPGEHQQDSYLYSRQLPTRLSAKDQTSILEVARQGAQALKLRATSLHIELILTSQGPKLIEIGARIGGYRARMYELGCRLNLYQAAIDIAEGRPSQLPSGGKASCIAVLELFPDRDGQFQGLDHEHELRQLPSFHYLSMKRQLGEAVGMARHGYRAVAVVMLKHSDAEQFQTDFAEVADLVRVRVT